MEKIEKCSCKEKLVGTGLDSRENNEMLRWKIHCTMDVVFSDWGECMLRKL